MVKNLHTNTIYEILEAELYNHLDDNSYHNKNKYFQVQYP